MQFRLFYIALLLALLNASLFANAAPAPSLKMRIDPRLRAWQWDRRFCRLGCRFADPSSDVIDPTVTEGPDDITFASATVVPALPTSNTSSSSDSEPESNSTPADETSSETSSQSSGALTSLSPLHHLTALSAAATVLLMYL